VVSLCSTQIAYDIWKPIFGEREAASFIFSFCSGLLQRSEIDRSQETDERPSQAPLIFLNLHKVETPASSFLQSQMQNVSSLREEVAQLQEQSEAEPNAALLKLAKNAKYSTAALQKVLVRNFYNMNQSKTGITNETKQTPLKERL
jgi:hypothetical protein